MKPYIAGTGYIGLSNGKLLSQTHDVMTLDIVQEKVSMLNEKKSSMEEKEIQQN